MTNKKNKLIPKLRFPEFENDGEWEEKRLGDITNSENSTLTLNKIENKKNGFSVYGADGVVGHIDKFQHKERYISIVKDGSGVGRLNLCEPKSSILGTLSCIKSKNLEKFDIHWIYYLMNTINFTSYKKGSGIPHIYYSDFKNELIPLPSLEEQQRIANCLSSLDELIEVQEEKLKLLKEHKKGLMQQLFPQANDNRDITRGGNLPKLRFPEFINDGAWEVCNITNGKSNAQDHIEGGKYPLFDRSEVIKTSNEYIFDTEAVIIPGEGMKFIPKYYEGKFNLHQRAYALKGFSIHGKFIYYSMLNNNVLLSRKAVQSTVLSLRLPILQNFPVQVPKQKKEQQKIADCLSSLDETIEAQDQKIELLKQHKKGLMQGLFPVIN